jgi:hypothetical protein
MRRFVLTALVLLVACSSSLSPVATQREFSRWVDEDSVRQASFTRFRDMLVREGVGDVVPVYDLWIVDRLRPECVHAPFVQPPEEEWPHIVATLRFVRDYVEPVVGLVRAVSAYRDQSFNQCVGGAPASAHRSFYAVDLAPVDATMTRQRLIEALCEVHAREGERWHVGLGIYDGRRFHIDTRSYRGWGADHHVTSFPCNGA